MDFEKNSIFEENYLVKTAPVWKKKPDRCCFYIDKFVLLLVNKMLA